MLRAVLNQSEINLNTNTLQTGLNFGARHVHKDNGELVECFKLCSLYCNFILYRPHVNMLADVFKSRFARDGLGWLTGMICITKIFGF